MGGGEWKGVDSSSSSSMSKGFLKAGSGLETGTFIFASIHINLVDFPIITIIFL